MADDQRRARLVARHHLSRTAAGVVEAVRSVVALHSSDPATPYLGARARVAGFETDDLDRALYVDRDLCRVHAMRRTLFVVPTSDLAVIDAAASRDVARKERKRLEGWLANEIGSARAAELLAALEARVLETLAAGDERRTRELAAEIPGLATAMTVGSGRWTTRAPVSSRLLSVMAMEGRLVRGTPAGSWRSSQYRWAAAEPWLGALPEPVTPAEGRVELARRYIAAHGPVTVTDLRWWTGWTAKQAAAALAELDVARVTLDDGGEGLVLAGDVEAEPAASSDPSIALLPGLDPTPMGWKERDWYLGPHGARLFDRSGNVGPTAWVGGRIVGGWGQRPDGEVVVELLESTDPDVGRRIAAEAASLGEWLAGTAVIPRFRTPLERSLRDS